MKPAPDERHCCRVPTRHHHVIRAQDSILLRRSHVDGSSDMDCVLADLSLHAVLYNDRSNTLRRRAFTQTHFNPLADSSITSGSVGGGRIYGGLAATSQSLSSVFEVRCYRKRFNNDVALTHNNAVAKHHCTHTMLLPLYHMRAY